MRPIRFRVTVGEHTIEVSPEDAWSRDRALALPDFGCDLSSLLGEALTPAMEERARRLVAEELRRQFPREEVRVEIVHEPRWRR